MPQIIYLVSCVDKKLEHNAPASELYISQWFFRARGYVRATGCPWYILSAKHHLLDPGRIIEPYNERLKGKPIAARKQWAINVFDSLPKVMEPSDMVVLLAFNDYREFLVPLLRGASIKIDIPMQGLGIGQQLHWLGERHD
jgi:hypothetical protein